MSRALGFLRRLATSPFRALAGAWRAAVARPKRAMAMLGSIGAVGLLLCGTFLYLGSSRDATESARAQARTTAERDVVTLLSYQHGTVANEVDQRSRLLTGKFQRDYTDLLQKVVVPGAQRQGLTTSTNVAHSSVIRNDGDDRVSLMLFLNQTTKSQDQPDPMFNGSRVRVGMQRIGDDWAVSEITPL